MLWLRSQKQSPTTWLIQSDRFKGRAALNYNSMTVTWLLRLDDIVFLLAFLFAVFWWKHKLMSLMSKHVLISNHATSCVFVIFLIGALYTLTCTHRNTLSYVQLNVGLHCHLEFKIGWLALQLQRNWMISGMLMHICFGSRCVCRCPCITLLSLYRAPVVLFYVI